MSAAARGLPAIEVTCTGAYFIALSEPETRRLLACWRHHESQQWVDQALARMRRGETVTVPATQFRYRVRAGT